ncbi:MAG: hypothetical protein H0X27_01850 [Caulobacteraceae bacterium]|nr:hypothetical protein [Caulobacteraceae bacterium]
MERDGPCYEEHVRRIKRELADIVDVSFRASPFRTLKTRFLVACSARSGSHLLCESLADHGAAAREAFDAKWIAARCRQWRLRSLEAYCQALIGRLAPNGVFGVKGGIQILAPLELAGELPRHLADWRFVFLKRQDSLKQAISQYIASSSGSYRSSKAPRRILTDDDFDGRKIATMARGRQLINAEWEQFFTAHGVEPHRVDYEDMIVDLPGVVARVTEYLDIHGPPIPARLRPPPFERQATELNSRWEARFKAEGWSIGAI